MHKDPGSWDQIYASNFNDSGMYVGGCRQVCDTTIDHAWMEYSALGYSGTNSGGAIVIENSQFDNNKDGADTNTQIDGDAPAPQNGDCPGKARSPITHTRSCWVFIHNSVHDNNNPNVPQAGSASAGPTGNGNDRLGRHQRHRHGQHLLQQRRLGHPLRALPRQRCPRARTDVRGNGRSRAHGFGCVYDPKGDALLDNTFTHDGYFGNQSNADFGQIVISGGGPQNCFAGNSAPDRKLTGRPRAEPAHVQRGDCSFRHRGGAARGGPVRHGLRSLPGGVSVPAAHGHHHAPGSL